MHDAFLFKDVGTTRVCRTLALIYMPLIQGCDVNKTKHICVSLFTVGLEQTRMRQHFV